MHPFSQDSIVWLFTEEHVQIRKNALDEWHTSSGEGDASNGTFGWLTNWQRCEWREETRPSQREGEKKKKLYSLFPCSSEWVLDVCERSRQTGRARERAPLGLAASSLLPLLFWPRYSQEVAFSILHFASVCSSISIIQQNWGWSWPIPLSVFQFLCAYGHSRSSFRLPNDYSVTIQLKGNERCVKVAIYW